MWVKIPPRLRKRLEAVACTLHCTLPEAASRAVCTQLVQLEAALASVSRRDGPVPESDAPQK